MDNLAAQAPLLAVLCLAVGALFAALQKVNNDTIADLRKRLDGQQEGTGKALVEIKEALKDLVAESRRRRGE